MIKTIYDPETGTDFQESWATWSMSLKLLLYWRDKKMAADKIIRSVTSFKRIHPTNISSIFSSCFRPSEDWPRLCVLFFCSGLIQYLDNGRGWKCALICASVCWFSENSVKICAAFQWKPDLCVSCHYSRFTPFVFLFGIHSLSSLLINLFSVPVHPHVMSNPLLMF